MPAKGRRPIRASVRRHSPRRTTSRIRWHGLGDPEVEVITISLTQRFRRAFDNPGDGKGRLSLPGWRTRSVRRSGTESSQTLCWSKPDSNPRSHSSRPLRREADSNFQFPATVSLVKPRYYSFFCREGRMLHTALPLSLARHCTEPRAICGRI